MLCVNPSLSSTWKLIQVNGVVQIEVNRTTAIKSIWLSRHCFYGWSCKLYEIPFKTVKYLIVHNY